VGLTHSFKGRVSIARFAPFFIYLAQLIEYWNIDKTSALHQLDHTENILIFWRFRS
jgi:hypothetical protein